MLATRPSKMSASETRHSSKPNPVMTARKMLFPLPCRGELLA